MVTETHHKEGHTMIAFSHPMLERIERFVVAIEGISSSFASTVEAVHADRARWETHDRRIDDPKNRREGDKK